MALRLLSLCTVLLAGLAFSGCGDDDNGDPLPNIETLFPANNAVGTWKEDTSQGAAGVETANTDADVYAVINGDADKFTQVGFASWAREFYTDGTSILELRIWQMRDTTGTKTIYDGVIEAGGTLEDARYSGSTWNPVSIGEAGRVADTGSSWWINARKSVYMVEASNIRDPGAGTHDATLKDSALLLVGAVIDKIP